MFHAKLFVCNSCRVWFFIQNFKIARHNNKYQTKNIPRSDNVNCNKLWTKKKTMKKLKLCCVCASTVAERNIKKKKKQIEHISFQNVQLTSIYSKRLKGIKLCANWIIVELLAKKTLDNFKLANHNNFVENCSTLITASTKSTLKTEHNENKPNQTEYNASVMIDTEMK